MCFVLFCQDGNTTENADNEKKEKKNFLSRFKKGKKEVKAVVDDGVVRYTLLDVLKNRRLRMYAFIMCCLW